MGNSNLVLVWFGMWFIVMGMWLVCGQYVVSKGGQYGRYAVSMWSLRWSVCGQYVVSMQLVCGR